MEDIEETIQLVEAAFLEGLWQLQVGSGELSRQIAWQELQELARLGAAVKARAENYRTMISPPSMSIRQELIRQFGQGILDLFKEHK